jgi:hypothetical protein
MASKNCCSSSRTVAKVARCVVREPPRKKLSLRQGQLDHCRRLPHRCSMLWFDVVVRCRRHRSTSTGRLIVVSMMLRYFCCLLVETFRESTESTNQIVRSTESTNRIASHHGTRLEIPIFGPLRLVSWC